MKTLFVLMILIVSFIAVPSLNAVDKFPKPKLPYTSLSEVNNHFEHLPTKFLDRKNIEHRKQNSFKKKCDEFQSKNYLIDTIKVYKEGGGEEFIICSYDLNQNLLIYLSETFLNGELIDSYRYTFSYNSDGNKLTELFENWDYVQLVNNRRWSYNYDSNGNILLETFEKWGKWKLADCREIHIHL